MALNDELRKLRKSVDSKHYNIVDFFDNFGKRLNSQNTNEVPIYHNIRIAEDAISEDLNKVCMAYDDVSDRGLVWVTEQYRVGRYGDSLYDKEHVGTIALIDLKTNIESLEELIKDPNYLKYKEELQDEVTYWSKYYKNGEGHRFFVFIGKNRSLFALPMLYEQTIEDYGKDKGINVLKQAYEVDVKVYTKYITRRYKTALYRNEKDNFKDTPLMEWIGYTSEITDLVNDETKTELAKTVMPKMFNVDERIKYQDRQLVLDCYSVYNERYADKAWMKKQFEDNISLTAKFKTVFKYFLNVYKTLYHLDASRIKLFNNQSIRMLVFRCCQEIQNGVYELKEKKTQYEDVLKAIFDAHQNLDSSNKHYGFRKDGWVLTFNELKSGMSGNSGYFHKDGKLFTKQDEFDKDKCKSKYKSRKQGDVLIEIFVSEFLKVLNENDKLVLPAKRGFTHQDFSYIVKRDNGLVRINGEVYDKEGNVKRFSDEKPDDVLIKYYGTDNDYVPLRFEQLWGTDVQVDHISAFSKNKDVKDLDKCELTSSTFNNWKDNRKAVYELKAISKISKNIDLMNIE